MRPRLYDAHNHLQDARLLPHAESISAGLAVENVQQMVVNGSSEKDWPEVLALARSNTKALFTQIPEILGNYSSMPSSLTFRAYPFKD